MLKDTASNKFIKNIICTISENKKFQHKNNKDISIDNLTLNFHGTNVLDGASLKIN